MSGSRGDSPDWIRCFQAPAHSVLTLSSDESGSSPSPSPSPSPSRSKDDTTDSLIPADDGHPKTALGQSGAQSPSNKISETEAPIKGTELEVEVDRALPKKTKPRGNHEDAEVTEEDISEKHDGAHASKSRLPLVLSEKVHRTKALIECEGNSIDLSGDVGAVGRVMITDTPSGNCDMYLDLKGTIYRTTIVPSRTFCVVNFGQSEAKIEAIMNDFIQLKPQSNVHEAETMVEGTLEGFSFDSEEEAETMPKTISRQADQNEGTGEQTDGKPKGKSGKTSRTRKKGGMGLRNPQPAKKQRKKAQELNGVGKQFTSKRGLCHFHCLVLKEYNSCRIHMLLYCFINGDKSLPVWTSIATRWLNLPQSCLIYFINL